jgi:hypothetical protein
MGREAAIGLVRQMGEPSNKGMKLTKLERIGALQLIPGVRPTGLRRQNGLSDDGLPATDCRLEAAKHRVGWARE